MKYSGTNIRVSVSALFKSNKAIGITILFLLLLLGVCLFYFYRINQSRIEVLDCYLTIKDKQLTKIDSLQIEIFHSYKSDFSLKDKDDTTRNLKNIFEQSSTPTYSVYIHYNESATAEAKHRLSLPDNDADKIPLQWKESSGLIQLYDTVSRFQVYNSTDLVLQTNNKRFSTRRMLRSIRFGGIQTQTGKPIAEGEALHCRAHINYKPEMTKDGARYHLHEDLIYRFEDSEGIWDNECEPRGTAIYSGPLKTSLQPVYNIYFRNLSVPDSTSCTLTIRFPSATSFELTSIQPDVITPLSIVYNTTESIKEISRQGLFINARPLSNNNFIETRNFILATVIGAILSIIIDLIITLIKDYSKMIESSKRTREEK